MKLFRYIFIVKHKKTVLDYIDRVLVREWAQCSQRRYALPDLDEAVTPQPTAKGGTDLRALWKRAKKLQKARQTMPWEKASPRGLERDLVAWASSLHSAQEHTFTEMLQQHIRRKALMEPEVYKAAQIDRRLFSKIIGNREYKPAKDTAIALALALRLTADEAKDLLERAGYALSRSIRRDIAIEYFFHVRAYNLDNINALLYEIGEKIIGRDEGNLSL